MISVDIFGVTILPLASIYPLCLWFNYRHRIAGYYYKHLLIATLAAAICTVFIWVIPIGFQLRLSALVWLISLIAITLFFWNRDRINNWIASLPVLFGLIITEQVVTGIIQPDWITYFSVFAGAVCVGLLAVLISNLKIDDNTVMTPTNRRILLTIIILIFLRLLVVYFNYRWGHLSSMLGDEGLGILWYDLEGHILVFGIFSGMLIPVIAAGVVLVDISQKAFNAARKLVWPVLVFVIIAELILKYYLLKYGIAI